MSVKLKKKCPECQRRLWAHRQLSTHHIVQCETPGCKNLPRIVGNSVPK